jgi:hypothetical protein
MGLFSGVFVPVLSHAAAHAGDAVMVGMRLVLVARLLRGGHAPIQVYLGCERPVSQDEAR